MVSSLADPSQRRPQWGHVAVDSTVLFRNIILISTICPGENQDSHGFERSISRLVFVCCNANSPLNILRSPACLKRIFSTARNASLLVIHSRWMGAHLFCASRNITGCCRST
jgi:hypothetical protein